MRYVLSNGRGEFICGPHYTDYFLGCRADRAVGFDSPKEARDWMHKWTKEYVGEFDVYSIETVVKKWEEL